MGLEDFNRLKEEKKARYLNKQKHQPQQNQEQNIVSNNMNNTNNANSGMDVEENNLGQDTFYPK
jgi:hypothetical protein